MENVEQNRVLDTLWALLRGHPHGIKEYDLLQECRGKGLPFLEADSLLDALVLYRVHFLLFHFLYLLQARLRRRREGDLEIHCLAILLKPWPGEDAALPEPADPLRNYYLDLDQWRTMTRQEAESLLDGFWDRFGKWDQRRDALAVLGLKDPVDERDITRQYHHLAKNHHPDHGGDPAIFRQILNAMDILR